MNCNRDYFLQSPEPRHSPHEFSLLWLIRVFGLGARCPTCPQMPLLLLLLLLLVHVALRLRLLMLNCSPKSSIALKPTLLLWPLSALQHREHTHC